MFLGSNSSQNSVGGIGGLIPMRFVWPYGGRRVYLMGSFTRWSEFIQMVPMEGCPTVFQAIINLTPGHHQFKFFVDGQYHHDEHQPFISCNIGVVNTVFLSREPEPDVSISGNNMDVDNENSRFGEILKISQSDLEVSRSRISKFLSTETVYKMMPDSGKEIVLDVDLAVEQAFHILYQQGACMSVLWDSHRGQFAGILSPLDFILILKELGNHGSNLTEEELEMHTIAAWKQRKPQMRVDTQLSFMILFILNKIKSSERLPAGPTKLPIIGNLHNLFFAGDDHIPCVLRDLAKKHGPFMHLKMGQISQIIISSSEFAKEFLKTHDINFASRNDIFTTRIVTYNNSDIVFAPYGQYWRQVRKLVTLNLLNVKKVKSFNRIRRSEVCQIIDILTKAAIDATPVNLSQIFLTFNNISTRSMFGNDLRHQEAFLDAMKEFLDILNSFNICNYFPLLEDFTAWLTGMKKRAEKTHRTIDHILDKIIDEHLQKSNKDDVVVDGEGDLLDTLLKLQKKNEFDFEFTMSNLKAIILDMMTGGTETGSTTLEWIMSELVKNPKTLKKVTYEVRQIFTIISTNTDDYNNSFSNEMSYMQDVIKETLRLHPPLPLLIPHECREKCQINGYDIEKKASIIVNIWAIGRDPNKWEDPEIFKPERFNGNPIDIKGSHFDLIPFGSGRRICPGITFGMTNVELLLASILYHFDWKIPNDVPRKELDMTECFKGTLGRKNPLILVPVFPTTT